MRVSPASPLVAALARGATVLTPTRRLARDLKRRHDRARLADGEEPAWPAADVLPWPAWLLRTWDALPGAEQAPRVLSALEMAAHWQQAVQADLDRWRLLDAAAAARLAAEAHQLAADWALAPERDPFPSEDARAFLGWQARVVSACRRAGGLDPARLPGELAARLRGLRGVDAGLPRELVLAGFDSPAPALRLVMEALGAAGVEVSEASLAGPPGHCDVVGWASAEAELAGVAAAVRAHLESHPEARIGVVVPDLHARRAAVVQAFTHALEPRRLLSPAAASAPAFELSLGEPLSRVPLAAAALCVLRLASRDALPLPDLGGLLRSPFIGQAEAERPGRALLDARLRERGALEVSVSTLRFEAAPPGGGSHACPGLARRLEAWVPLAARARELRQLPSAWSGTLQELLSVLGWPGERPLDSAGFQAAQRWRALVAGLSPLDAVLGRVNVGTALSWLSRLASETVFQPESGDAPVQVLGLLEAAGLAFDRLFVTGLADDVFPAAPAPHPMLPLALQRGAGVPRADAQWEAGFAQRSFALLCASAPRVTFSWAALDGERERRASPLLAGLPPALAVAPPPGAPERLRASGAVEAVVDPAAPALPEGACAGGGARLIEDQSACPFRAFARHRLGAAALAEGVPGLGVGDRGTLLHDALAVLWRGLGSSAALRDATPEERDRRVAAAADEALARFARRRGERLTPALRQLEAARLTAAMGAMLEQEALRAPFTVVACELEREVAVGGLALRARLDRVDALADGRRVVIDFKSGRARTRQWDGERPEQPQLPLYAVTEPAAVAAVAFGVLRPGEVAFAGAGDGEGLLPGVQDWSQRPEGWQGTLSQWRAVLEALAREFTSGRADVAPRDGLKTCTHCELGPLCRVREILAGEADEDAGDDDA